MDPRLSSEQIRRLYAPIHAVIRRVADECAVEFARALRTVLGGSQDAQMRRQWLESESLLGGTEVRRSFRHEHQRYSARASVAVDDVREPWLGVTLWLGRGEEDQLIHVSMPGAPFLRLLDPGSVASLVGHLRYLRPHAAEAARLAAPILLALAEDEVGPGLLDFVIPAPGTAEQRIRIAFP